MAFTMSRTARILLLLVIDVAFFFVEIIVGYAVGSLALVADSFHMLNDVLSLVVALYAIKLTAQNTTDPDPRYTYGWHRAEILAALVNGVFLLALCFSIFLDAVERFFSPSEVSNPKLVVVVGSLGLASNILGLFLFHEHSHSHGDHDDHADSKAMTPTTHTPLAPSESTDVIATPNGQERKNSQQRTTRDRSNSYSSLYGHPVATRASMVQAAQEIAQARSPSPVRGLSKKRHSSRSRNRPSVDLTGESEGRRLSDVDDASEGEDNMVTSPLAIAATESTPLLDEPAPGSSSPESSASHTRPLPKSKSNGGGHGHSHAGSMNMRALVLHVLGDALGNVGVIATGLVIWFSTWSFKYYFDPMISLVITVIIFSSAMPLVRSTSYILLQGVPSSVSIEDVREAILATDGVLSVHELHIWQLSESKVVASVHVTASRDHDFMTVAAKIREELHHQGIHSTTIQPEYHPPQNAPPEEALKTSADTSCLILCPPDQACAPENACCPPPAADA